MSSTERAFGREQLGNLGRQIRALREGRRWSLKRLARESGISITAIRKIELGEANPGLLTILAIVDALGEPIDRVIGLARAQSLNICVTRAGDHRTADRVPSSRALTSGLSEASMFGRVVTLPPRTSIAAADRGADGAQFGFVLDGSVRLTLSDGTVKDLSAGDSFHTVEPSPTIIANAGASAAQLLQVKDAGGREEGEWRSSAGGRR
jgi:transcriptional regulator with XRE-family HTH domain